MKTYTITQEQLNATPKRDHSWRWPGVTGPGEYTWDERANTYRPVSKPATIQQPAESPFDFDGGFGIGGLGRYEEKPIIPSVKALGRYERMQARATTCRRCGQTDVFDGAMFTTLGGNICDDCA